MFPADKRRYPRFSYTAPVLFHLPDEPLWSVGTLVDISIGGIFFRTPHVLRDKLQLQFRIVNRLDGVLVMVSGTMVRLLDEAPYGTGVGVEFAMPGSSPELRRLCDYLMTAQPDARLQVQTKAASTFDMTKALTLARTLLDNVQFMNYYQLMGLSASATPAQLVDMRNALVSELNIPREGLSAADRRTLDDALSLMVQVSDILCNPHKRLAYDLSQGQVDPFVVRELAHDYQIDMRPYSAVWQQKYPDRIRRAALLWQESRSAYLEGRVDEAREKATQAMELDPFNFMYSANF